MVQFYGLSDVFWTLKQMLNHIKLLKDSTFIMVKKNVKIYSMVSPECKVKLSVAFRFLSYSNVAGAPVAR